jgi:hypothetical protein
MLPQALAQSLTIAQDVRRIFIAERRRGIVSEALPLVRNIPIGATSSAPAGIEIASPLSGRLRN